ncbi:hypothetical protein FOCC_FOCC006216 [Frankliniella occidentalis]|nr:hypothetical protein FOCC_FOCC006216 [Frankliniella occidentalis]
MNTFLKPFSEELLSISERPVEWTHPQTSEAHESEVKVQLAVADAPARAKMQNILNFNGKHGCNMCEIKTKKCLRHPAFKRRKRIYPYKHNIRLRTAVRMKKQAEQAVENGDDVKGIDKPGRWSIKNHIEDIDSLLKDILHPDFVHRVSRQLGKLSYWKASDYYYFLLFESLPVLKDFLPGDHYQHFILLVRSIFQLLKRSITQRDLEEADLCLKLFVNRFCGLYPDRDLTYNIHQLLHLSLSVKRHGPLSCTSAFGFEGMNGTIAKVTHGTYNIGMEIVNNIKICQGVAVLKKVSEGLHGYQSISLFCKGEPLGGEIDIDISQEEKGLINNTDFKIYSRAKVGYEVFTSLIHKKLKSANYNIMLKEYGVEKYARINFFFVCNGDLGACLKLYKVDHLNVIYNTETLKTIEHLVPVLNTEETIIVSGETLASFIKVGKVKNYLCKRPNLFHQVL